MTRFNACFASQSHQMHAAAHTAEAFCPCHSSVNNMLVITVGAILLASIFVISAASIRLQAIIIISIIMGAVLIMPGPRIAILKEPPGIRK